MNRRLHSGLNNVYHKENYPAFMNDGRFITNYGSTHELTETMRRSNGFQNHNEFRRYMQENAEDFINADRNRVAVENDIRLPDVACSEGWRSLWTVHNGTWNLA